MRGFEVVSLNEFKKNCSEIYYEHIVLPERSTKASAGYDFSIPYDCLFAPGKIIMIYTGIKAYMPADEVLFIVIRSSTGIKLQLGLVNHVAVIDSDYYGNLENEGHIIIAIKNNGIQDAVLSAGARFAQGIFVPYLTAYNEKAPQKNRKGGLGSTK